MLLGGDEIGRTQRGNNNAYCQDNEISWYDWERVDEDLLEFTRRLIALRREHPVFRRRRWFQGRPIRGTVDIGWFRPDGTEMDDDDWDAGFAQSIGVFLNGDAITDRDERGQRSRRLVPAPVQRPRRADRLDAADAVGQAVGAGHRDGRHGPACRHGPGELGDPPGRRALRGRAAPPRRAGISRSGNPAAAIS